MAANMIGGRAEREVEFAWGDDISERNHASVDSLALAQIEQM